CQSGAFSQPSPRAALSARDGPERTTHGDGAAWSAKGIRRATQARKGTDRCRRCAVRHPTWLRRRAALATAPTRATGATSTHSVSVSHAQLPVFPENLEKKKETTFALPSAVHIHDVAIHRQGEEREGTTGSWRFHPGRRT
ncbi:MAG: hypothetical protein ACPIOQ_18120, partial [Promethearchaeia archaeon]